MRAIIFKSLLCVVAMCCAATFTSCAVVPPHQKVEYKSKKKSVKQEWHDTKKDARNSDKRR